MQPVDIWGPIAQGASLGMQLANQQFDMGRAMTMDAVAMQQARDRSRLVQQQIDAGLREQGYQHAARQFNKNQFRQLMGSGLLPQAQGPGPYDAGAAGGPISMDAAQDDANGQLEQLFGQLDPRQQNLFLEGASRYQQEYQNRDMTLRQLDNVYGQRDREIQTARGTVGNESADRALERNRMFRESATAQVFGVGSGAQAQIMRGTMPGGGGAGDIGDDELRMYSENLALGSGFERGTPEFDNKVNQYIAERRLNNRIAARSIGRQDTEEKRAALTADRDQWNAELQAINKTLDRVNRRREAAFKEFTKARDAGEIVIGQGAYNEKLLPISNLDQEIDELEARRDAIIGGRSMSGRPQQPNSGAQQTQQIANPQASSVTPKQMLEQAIGELSAEGVTKDNTPEYTKRLQEKYLQIKGRSGPR
jgi:uncharacterized protein YukE